MSGFIETFKKQGGLQLVKNYWNSGVLMYAVGQIFITGKSQKSLEFLRLGTQIKIKSKLEKKYINVLEEFENIYNNKYSNLSSQSSSKIWVCWMQGIENAPSLVQRCFRSLKDNLSDKDIILITSDNYKDYTDIPSWIIDKYEKGIISHTHFSDLLRIELLCKHGGTWIDSTVFCSGKNIPSYMMDSDLFMFQNLKPGADGSAVNISSWFISAKSNNKILLAVRYLLWEYWKTENSLIDYFLLHFFISIVQDFYKDMWRQIVQIPNSLPHVLLLMMFEQFDQTKWDAITQMCPFHKLAYKRSEEDMAKEGTYYQYLMNN